MKSSKLFFSLALLLLIGQSCKIKLIDNEDSPKPKNEKVYDLLTGNNSTFGKTWKLCPDPYKTAVGPIDRTDIQNYNFYNFPEGINTWPMQIGALQNSYTFIAKSDLYKPYNPAGTAGKRFLAKYYGLAPQDPSFGMDYSDTVFYDPLLRPAPFRLVNANNGIGTGYTLEITDGSYLGIFDGYSSYQIMSITKDTMKLRHPFSEVNYVKDSTGRIIIYSPTSPDVAFYTTYVAVK